MSELEYSVLVVDDHPMIRRGLRNLLAADKYLSQVLEASDPNEALRIVAREHPEVVILDLSFPTANGMDVIAKIRGASPKTEILVFTMYTSPDLVRKALTAGARGFVAKLDPDLDVLHAISAVRSGREVVSYRLRSQAAATVPQNGQKITPRELEILKLLAEGKSNREAAKALGLSVRTVEAHRTIIMRKMAFKNMAELIRFAIRIKLIEA